MKIHWKTATLALGAVLAAGTTATAQDQTVRLGGSASMFKNGLSADTMTLGGQGTLESAREADNDLTRGYGRGGWGGGGRGGWGGGGRGGWGGGGRGGWGGGRGGWGGGVRIGVGFGGGWGRGGWARGGWGWGGGGWNGGGIRVVVGSPFVSPVVISGWSPSSSCFYGVAATPIDLSTQAVPLNMTAQSPPVPVIRIPATVLAPRAPATDNRTFPYDGGPKQLIPQPLDAPRATPIPEPIPPSDSLRVVLKRDDPTVAKLQYAYKAYGER